jgi:hypothetical protein
MTPAVMPDARETNTPSAATKPVAKPAAVAALPETEQSSKRGRKPGQVTKPKVTGKPTTRFFGGDMDGDLPRITREYADETEAVLDSFIAKKKFFAITAWDAVYEKIGGNLTIVKRPATSEQQNA